MIYINENIKEIQISRHLDYSSEPSRFILRHNLSENEYLYTDLDIQSQNAFYYTMNVEAINVPIGEYTFYLNDENGYTLESGLLTYGDYKPIQSTIYSSDKSNDIIYERN